MANTQTEPKTNWQFQQNSPSVPTGLEQPQPPGQPISWTASEYVAHDKDTMWYVQFSLLSLLVVGGTFLLTRDFISVFILTALAIGIAVFAARKPDTLNYQIDDQGIHVGSKLYPISLFKSFAIVEEGQIQSISLLPLKRFMPSISVYFAPDDEQKIVDTLSAVLPQETRQQDPVDKFMHKIRF